MKAKSIVMLAAISVALLACSKKKDETAGPSTGENKKYLTRVTTVTTGPVADGSVQTTSTTDYSYDSKKRLILAKTGTTSATAYAYYDDGNLYTVTTTSNGKTANRAVYEFTYEGGKLKSYRLKGYKDNTISTNILYDYVYNGDKVSEIHFDIYYLLFTYDTNGNVTKVFSHGNPDFSYIYQYDDKKSKFTNSMFKYPTVGDIAGDRSNPNNRTFRTTEGLNLNVKSTFVYTYDADGYPTTCLESSDYAASSTYKSTYTYSTLN